MRQDICTIPISEIFEVNDGCPICRMREVIEKHLKEEDKEMSIGTCVDFDNFALCIASIHDGVITRVDILKTN